ncbi:MAG: exo-alpha-sialidase, partial [bacterium]|nr:exo-alpha-sialidase [bacterium]
NNGLSWTGPAPLNNNAGTDERNDFNPEIAADGFGNWVVVWDSTDSLGESIGEDWDVLMARSSGGGWSGPTPLNHYAASDPLYVKDDSPHVAADGAGNWVGVWMSIGPDGALGEDGDILMARSAGFGGGDCNHNGISDECDIASGTSEDCNANTIPDECETPLECPITITEVTSEHVSPAKARTFFLDGVSLSQTFTATVDWDIRPEGVVRFITPLGSFDGVGAGDTWTRTLDMGSDFGPGGLLTVVAESADATPLRSAPYVANLKVIAAPPGLTSGGWSVAPLSDPIKYVKSADSVNLNI